MKVTCLTIHVVESFTSTIIKSGKTFAKKIANEWQQRMGESWLSKWTADQTELVDSIKKLP